MRRRITAKTQKNMDYEARDATQRGLESIMKPNSAAANGRSSRKRNGARADPLGHNSEIGRKLKQYYDELVTEDVPDRFAELLRQLEAHEPETASRDGD
jgi:hypothetical protein